MRYKTEQILKQSIHRGGFKKYEVVENVVKNFCKIWGIEDWKLINDPELSRKMYRPKLSLIILLSDFLLCAAEDVNKYFYIKGSRDLFINARVRFEEICKLNNEYAYLHNECVRVIKNSVKEVKDWFLIKKSRIYADEGK